MCDTHDTVDDIACDSMTPSKLEKLKTEAEALRHQGGVSPSEVERLAHALGRRRANRGKHPMWVSDPFPHLRPVSIPNHGREMKRFTKNAVLDQLEEDFENWQIRLD